MLNSSPLRISLFSIALLVACFAAAFEAPPLTGPLVDEIGLFSSSERAGLESLLYQAQKRGRVQLQVAVLASLQGISVEEASIKIVEKWKLGTAKQDNGILFLIVPSEKRMRIEVGQGLEGDLPDVLAKRILADRVRPYFQRGQMSEGIRSGVTAILDLVDPELDASAVAPSPSWSYSEGRRLPGPLVLFVIFFFLLPLLGFLSRASRRGYASHGWRDSGYWGGGGGWGSGSGGGWSGGGGGFSGGGASGSW